MRSRRLAVCGLTAGLLGGGAAGLLLTGNTTLASAQTSDVTGTVTEPAAASTDPSTTTAAADSGSTTAPADPAQVPGPPPGAPKGDWAKSALDPLVTNGTLTQAQEDAVIAALDAARPARGPGGPGGPHG